MYVKRLSLEGVGRVGRLTLDLADGYNEIKSRVADEIVSALGAVTANREVKEIYPPKWADKKSSIFAEVSADGKRFAVRVRGKDLTLSAVADVHNAEFASDTEEYFSLMRRCAVEDRLCLIDVKRASKYHDLNVFLSEEKNFRPGELRRITDGIGTTRSFRAALRQYLVSETVAPEGKRCLLSRIDAVRFWDVFGKTRDMHYEGKPLLLVGVGGEAADVLPDLAELIKRQVVVFAPCTENGTREAV